MTNKEKIILVIDDEEMNLKLVEAMLISQGYKIVLYKSSTLAFQDIESINPDVILLDIMMPVMNGFDFLKKIKRIPKIKNVPVVMVTALNDVKSRVISLELGCDDFISKPIDKIELRSRVKSLIKVKEYYDHIKNHNSVLEEEIRKRTSELAESYRKVVAINKELEANFYNVVFMTFDLISNFDKSLAGHCKRVAEYCSKITDNLNIEQELKKNIKIAALLHDIGLIQIPKKNRMDINEDSNIGKELLEAYKNHPLISLKYFENSPKYSEIIRFIEGHHERLDGTGFPNGKKDKDILLGSKIIAIADYYDTLRYASKKTKDEEVIAQMEKKVGSWFDEEIFEIFRNIIFNNDPFYDIIEVDIKDLESGMIIAEAITSLDVDVVLLVSESILDKKKLDKIKKYSSKYNIKNPIKVYKNS